MVIELISSVNCSNLKIRLLAEEGFVLIQDVLKPFKASSQLLQTLLVGLAGTTPQLQSSTIRALVFNLKKLVVTKRSIDDSQLLSKEASVQEFIRKITKIIALFLKDQAAPKELHRSALKFIKVAITYLNFDTDSTLTSVILQPVFQLKTCRLYSMTLRRIITKLLIRVGSAKVRAATAKEHLSLVSYVERARRKKLNLKERAKLLALMGKKVSQEDGRSKDDSDSDSDSDPDEGKDTQMAS